MQIVNIGINPATESAVTLKDSTGEAVPLDRVWLDKQIKFIAPKVAGSILDRTGKLEDISEFEQLSETKITALFRRVLWQTEILNREQLKSGGNGRNITDVEIDTQEITSGKQKALGLKYVSTQDTEKIGSISLLETWMRERYAFILNNYMIARAHYGLDYAIKAYADTSNIHILTIRPNEMTGDQMQAQIIQIAQDAVSLSQMVTKYVPGINDEDIVIEMNYEFANNVYKIKDMDQSIQNLWGIVVDPLNGKLTGLRGFKIAVDKTMPKDAFYRVRWTETLMALIALNSPYTALDVVYQKNFFGAFWSSILGVRDVEFAKLGTTQAYLDGLTQINDPQNALYVPYYGNSNPQTKPFEETPVIPLSSSTSESSVSSSIKNIENGKEIIITDKTTGQTQQEWEATLKTMSYEELSKLAISYQMPNKSGVKGGTMIGVAKMSMLEFLSKQGPQK